ncbi:PTS system glucose-specific EIICB component [Photobacterium damselae subsp. piscicida]|uniref:PTS system glucose-specific EIICB component n=1 Tax=Photobacterium damsela subsp. piscicida TaxID=38294 RepID=A0AAD1CFU2_PHODP|nr:PTS system glucose-specific EIICB component [Photobacterium damselae subsp. piscicida]
MFKNLFASLQKVGKALMLPVSVLPVAGILLGVGAANFSWLPDILKLWHRQVVLCLVKCLYYLQ